LESKGLREELYKSEEIRRDGDYYAKNGKDVVVWIDVHLAASHSGCNPELQLTNAATMRWVPNSAITGFQTLRTGTMRYSATWNRSRGFAGTTEEPEEDQEAGGDSEQTKSQREQTAADASAERWEAHSRNAAREADEIHLPNSFWIEETRACGQCGTQNLANAWQCSNCVAFLEKPANVDDDIWDANRKLYMADMAQVLFPVSVVPDDGSAHTRGVSATHGDAIAKRRARKALNAARSRGKTGARNTKAENRLKKGGKHTSYAGYEDGAYPSIEERFLHDEVYKATCLDKGWNLTYVRRLDILALREGNQHGGKPREERIRLYGGLKKRGPAVQAGGSGTVAVKGTSLEQQWRIINEPGYTATPARAARVVPGRDIALQALAATLPRVAGKAKDATLAGSPSPGAETGKGSGSSASSGRWHGSNQAGPSKRSWNQASSSSGRWQETPDYHGTHTPSNPPAGGDSEPVNASGKNTSAKGSQQGKARTGRSRTRNTQWAQPAQWSNERWAAAPPWSDWSSELGWEFAEGWDDWK
jgi:hypothetical protein